MANKFLFIMFIALTLGLAAAAFAQEPAPPAAGAQPPEGVSPADPAAPIPDTHWCTCPRCGAEIPMLRKHMGGPQLGPGGSWDRPGREGRSGQGNAPRAHRHMDRISGAPRAMAGGIGAHAHRIPAEMMLRHSADLKLTDEQIDRLERLTTDMKKTLIDLRAEIERSEVEIENLIGSGSDDMTEIKRQLQAASNARLAIQEARIENLFAARDVLTDKQKKMVKEEFPRLGRMLE